MYIQRSTYRDLSASVKSEDLLILSATHDQQNYLRFLNIRSFDFLWCV